jgi:hypothetical protein
MKLFEHPDFEQAILRGADHFAARGLRPAIIEKDYYVTEALRIVAETAGDKTIFKGGTSLSKGWNLIERFSEDIDIFLDPKAFTPELGGNGINRELKALRDAVRKHPGLTFLPDDSKTIGGFGRSDNFSYTPHFGGPGEVAPRVLLEAATASGREPTVNVELCSFLSEYLQAAGVSLGADDESAFMMRLLHFRRTFVEKLFAIHGKIHLLTTDAQPLGTYARHYYDLFQLASHTDVTSMLAGEEYALIRSDYDVVSRTHFPSSYFPPEEMLFRNSDALFPAGALAATIEKEYEAQCKQLCYGPYPSWKVVQARFEVLRALL